MNSKCIDLQTLGDYFHDVLTHREKEQLMEHVVDCAACLEMFNCACHVMRNPELDQWHSISENEAKSILKETEFKSSVFGWIVGFLKKIAGMMTIPNRMPALSAVRSSRNENGLLLDKMFGKSKTRMTVEQGFEDKIHVRVGCANGIPGIDWAVLVREEGGIISLPFEGKEVLFENLSRGKYSLTMTDNEVEKDKCHFEIDWDGAHERKHDHT